MGARFFSVSCRSDRVTYSDCDVVLKFACFWSFESALVFSQWTRMLDLVQVPLLERGIQFVRLDGTMDSDTRANAIREFNKRSDIRLFLISLKAGGCGLNLTAANRVMMYVACFERRFYITIRRVSF
jgi:SNF2 family DNA or RNA helicase